MQIKAKWLLGLVSLFGWGSLSVAQPEPINVAVAANFAPAMRQIERLWQHDHERELALIVGASGTLATQILQGAPYALFLSADYDKVARLRNAQSSRVIQHARYAIGELVLVSRLSRAPWPGGLQASRIAIANPKIAPYGIASVAALNTLPNPAQYPIVQGNNVLHALQYYLSGSVDQALVAKSLALSQQIDFQPVDSRLYSPIEQWMALVKGASDGSQDAQVLFDFILSDAVQQSLIDYGFSSGAAHAE